MKLSHKFIIKAMLDPWENIRSITSEMVKADDGLHKKSVCKYYKIYKKTNEWLLYGTWKCMSER
jgi:hypothetical protein